jgi:chromate transport protein ChrA
MLKMKKKIGIKYLLLSNILIITIFMPLTYYFKASINNNSIIKTWEIKILGLIFDEIIKIWRTNQRSSP